MEYQHISTAWKESQDGTCPEQDSEAKEKNQLRRMSAGQRNNDGDPELTLNCSVLGRY